MRNLKIVFFLTALSFLSSMCHAQDVLDEKIDINYGWLKIEALLDSLHTQYAFFFSYDPSQLPGDSIINSNFKNQSIHEVLSKVFTHHDLNFQSVDRQIIISKYQRDISVKNYITVNGTVHSSENEQKIPLVNIAIKGQPLGTTTNMEGEFCFLIPIVYIGEQLTLSSIGYETQTHTVPDKDTLLSVNLRPQTIQLKEIKVRYIKPDEIIKRVIENRERNYFTHSMLLTAFFRESIKQDGKYIEVSEAVLDIYKSSYLKTQDKEEARFVKGRKKVEDNGVSVARLKLAGGPALFSAIDVVKHLDFMSQDEDRNYFYIYKGKDIVHGRVVYKVAFKPIVEFEDIYYEGEMYVDVETFALLKADFSMTKQTLRNSDRYLIQKHAKKVKSMPVHTFYQVNYRPYKDKWMLSNVRGELIIKMQDKKRKTKSEYHASAELLVTNAQNGNGRRIKISEAFKSKYVLADKIVGYDPMFWKDYNVIRPEDELQKVFKSSAVEINLVPQPD